MISIEMMMFSFRSQKVGRQDEEVGVTTTHRDDINDPTLTPRLSPE